MKHIERITIVLLVIMQIALLRHVDSIAEDLAVYKKVVWDMQLKICENGKCI